MSRDLDPRRAEWLEAMVRGISEEIAKTARGGDGNEFSLFMIPILQAVIRTEGRELGHFGGHAFPLGQKADELMIGTKVLRRYLKALAQAGLIKCVSWYDKRLKMRFPLEVLLSPDFVEACGNTRLGDARVYGRALGMTYLDRRKHESFQGFGDDDRAPWGRFTEREDGEPEVQVESRPGLVSMPADLPRSELIARVKAAAKGEKVLAARKRDEHLARRNNMDVAIKTAAGIWQRGVTRSGFADLAKNPPAWAAALKDLPQPLRVERQSLEKMFNLHGGLKTLVTWDIFCSGIKQVDKKGKPLFDMTIPHRQFVSPDKRPTAFVKNFDLIYAEIKAAGLLEDQAYLDGLRKYFGPILDFAPQVQAWSPTGGRAHGN